MQRLHGDASQRYAAHCGRWRHGRRSQSSGHARPPVSGSSSTNRRRTWYARSAVSSEGGEEEQPSIARESQFQLTLAPFQSYVCFPYRIAPSSTNQFFFFTFVLLLHEKRTRCRKKCRTAPEKQETGQSDQSVKLETRQDAGHGRVQLRIVIGRSSRGHLQQNLVSSEQRYSTTFPWKTRPISFGCLEE